MQNINDYDRLFLTFWYNNWKGENNNMKKEIYDAMMEYYDSSYKILTGDYSELEELEKDPKV